MCYRALYDLDELMHVAGVWGASIMDRTGGPQENNLQVTRKAFLVYAVCVLGLPLVFMCRPVRRVHLRGGDERAAHEHGEGSEADGVVLLEAQRAAARVRAEGRAVVQRDAHEEHRQPPAQRAEHALVAVPAERGTSGER